jgi:16S rRNA (cytosine967-C5)-methyltransferase
VPGELGAEPEWITVDGDLRTLPCHLPLDPAELSGLDGFYVARLERNT